jgi:hypothetical protein
VTIVLQRSKYDKFTVVCREVVDQVRLHSIFFDNENEGLADPSD